MRSSSKWKPRRSGCKNCIRTNPSWNGSRDFTDGMWLDLLERNPGLRYVSDGNPERISFPRAKTDQLAPQYRAQANPY